MTLGDGPYKNLPYRVKRQPFAKLLLEQMDNPFWREYAITGSNQSGKSLHCCEMPIMYHLFEIKEDVICATPDDNISKKVYLERIKPQIQHSRYRDLLPNSGSGAQGGFQHAIQFGNGCWLRFITAGGGDGSRSSYTARVIVVTEADKFADVGGVSKESTKLRQVKARALSNWGRRKIYMECTVTNETGPIWVEYQKGTASRLMLPCPHCKHFVHPEREHFSGFESAPDVLAAGTSGAICCPQCGQMWSDDERIAANHHARLLHRGQTIDTAGVIAGELPKTETCGFRWTASNNLMWTQADIAKAEWNALHAPDTQLAELAMRQQWWTLPMESGTVEQIQLTTYGLTSRQFDTPRGTVPSWANVVTVGIDVGKRDIHYTVTAFALNGVGVVVDHGTYPIPSGEFVYEQALLYTLRTLRDEILERGYTWQDHPHPYVPDQVWIDSGYQGERDVEFMAIYHFVKESGDVQDNRYRAIKGHGERDNRNVRYLRPNKVGKEVTLIGEEYHFALDPVEQLYLVHVNGDYWKTKLREALHVAFAGPGEAHKPGTLGLFRDSPRAHSNYVKQLLAEKPVQYWVDGKGWVTVWDRVQRANHYLDCTYYALAAAHFCGVRVVQPNLITPAAPPPETTTNHETFALPDGRPYFFNEREA